MAERSYKSNLIQQKRSSCKKCMKAVFFQEKGCQRIFAAFFRGGKRGLLYFGKRFMDNKKKQKGRVGV